MTAAWSAIPGGGQGNGSHTGGKQAPGKTLERRGNYEDIGEGENACAVGCGD